MSDVAEFLYKTTDYWFPEHEHSLAWNDPVLAIDWPLDGAPLVSGKDVVGVPLSEAEAFRQSEGWRLGMKAG